ncbi:MAG: hypothetical protein H7144_13030 [Burkholderiales bacterium]|nr:hypothetical protein [Phycisphaerae bacterium]
MSLAPHEIARRNGADHMLRHEAVPLAIEFRPIISRDGHEVIVSFESAMRLVDRAADVELFKEQMLAGHDSVTVDRVRQRLMPLLEGTLREFAAQHEAGSCGGFSATIEQLLLHRANEIGFGCGLEFIPPTRVAVHCPAIEARRVVEQVERHRHEQLDRQLDRAASILQRARQAGAVGVMGDALRADEQATLLQMLLRESAAVPVLVAAGSSLIRVEPHTAHTEPVNVPPGIGPLRSVQALLSTSGTITALGGRSGVAILTHDDLPPRVYTTDAQSDRGINSIAIDQRAGTLVAAHTELGLLRWDLTTAESLPTIAVLAPVRSLIAVGDRLYAAAGNNIIAVEDTSARIVHTGEGQIVSLLCTADSLWAIRQTGAVERLARSDPSQRLAGFDRSTQLQTAAMVQSEGLSVLALAGEFGPVELVSTAGTPLLELHSPFHGLRRLAHAGRFVIGVSADRQQLITWDTQHPAAPVRTSNILARFGNRIADIC